jgi:AcrR family transcriptional regulator
MTQPENNLRVRRTQKLLREALVELIEERGFDALTVGEITNRAMVSRAAFYRSYKDKFDLVEQIFAEAMGAMMASVSEPVSEHPPQVWIKFFEHIAKYERLFRALLGRKGSPWFVWKMRAQLLDLMNEYARLPLFQAAMGISDQPSANDFIADIIVTLLVEAITWWLEHDRPFSSEEMARRCTFLASAIYTEASTWK